MVKGLATDLPLQAGLVDLAGTTANGVAAVMDSLRAQRHAAVVALVGG